MSLFLYYFYPIYLKIRRLLRFGKIYWSKRYIPYCGHQRVYNKSIWEDDYILFHTLIGNSKYGIQELRIEAPKVGYWGGLKFPWKYKSFLIIVDKDTKLSYEAATYWAKFIIEETVTKSEAQLFKYYYTNDTYLPSRIYGVRFDSRWKI